MVTRVLWQVAEIGGNPEKISLQLRDKNSMLALFTQETAAEAEQMVNDYIGKSPGAYHVSYLQSDNPAVPEHDGKQSLQVTATLLTKHQIQTHPSSL